MKAWIVALATHTVSCFPGSDRLTLFICKKVSAKYPSLNNFNLSLQCQVQMMLAENKWLVELTTQAILRMLSLGQCPLLGSRNAFWVPLPSSHKTSGNVSSRGDLMKLIIFTVLSKAFLRKIGFICLFFIARPGSKEQNDNLCKWLLLLRSL